MRRKESNLPFLFHSDKRAISDRQRSVSTRRSARRNACSSLFRSSLLRERFETKRIDSCRPWKFPSDATTRRTTTVAEIERRSLLEGELLRSKLRRRKKERESRKNVLGASRKRWYPLPPPFRWNATLAWTWQLRRTKDRSLETKDSEEWMRDFGRASASESCVLRRSTSCKRRKRKVVGIEDCVPCTSTTRRA